MSEKRSDAHPDLFVLADWAEGSLDQAAAVAVERHVADCSRCALELKRLKRFATIQDDGNLEGEADWEAASDQLKSVFQSRIKTGHFPVAKEARSRVSWRWAAPVAAAAILIFVLVPSLRQGPELIPDGDSPLRGEGEDPAFLVPISPQGTLVAPPEYFAWKHGKKFDTYTLRIFTPELETVFLQTGISSAKRVVADSLLTSLNPGIAYLWTVTGHTELERESASVPVGFEIQEIPPQR